MYTRASASDYDDFQAEGWTTKELIPLMKKHETYQRPCNNRDIHRFEGPIKVSFGNYTYPIAWDFLRATESRGIPTTDDLQDLTTGHGGEHWLKWIDRDTSRRSDSAYAYIYSNMRQVDPHVCGYRSIADTLHNRNHGNLYLMCNTKVDKVIIENGHATALQTVPMKVLDTKQPQERIIKARKQIVISCGTLNTPLVLQRSSIGDPEKLQKAGVKCQVELPGVGLNFQDHYLTFSAYRAKSDTESFDDFIRGDPEVQKRVYDQWNLNGTGPLATNGIEAGVKVRLQMKNCVRTI